MQVETNPQEVEQTHSEACIYLLCISPAWPSSPAPWDLIDEYQSIYFMWAVKANYPANVKIFIPTGVTFQGFFLILGLCSLSCSGKLKKALPGVVQQLPQHLRGREDDCTSSQTLSK